MNVEVRSHLYIRPEVELQGRGHAILREALRRFHEIPYFVTGGTLLGLVRAGDLILTDTDVDFSVNGDEVAHSQVRSALSDWPLAREITCGNEVQQLVYLPEDVIFDVHFYRKRGDRYECHHGAGVLSFPEQLFAETQEIETEQFGAVRVPRNPEAYLVSKYGGDWRVPTYQKKGQYVRA